MPLLSFLDENRWHTLVTLSCLVWKTFSRFSLKFIVVRFFFFFKVRNTGEALNFSLDFPDKER